MDFSLQHLLASAVQKEAFKENKAIWYKFLPENSSFLVSKLKDRLIN
jgi:hypothetical protein